MSSQEDANPKFDDDTLRAIVSLDNNKDFIAFVEALKKRSVKLALLGSFVEDKTKARWFQGRVQEIQEILSSILQARVRLSAKKPNG